MSGLWRRWDMITTWLIIQVNSKSKRKLNYRDRSDKVWSIKKTRYDNDMIDHTSAVYVEIRNKLLRPIEQDTVYHKKQTRQRRDRSHRCDLYRIRYWTVKTYWIVCGIWRRRDITMTWPIIQVHSIPTTKMNSCDRSNKV